MKQYRIETDRFILKPLSLEDVTARYLSWFGDTELIPFIQEAKKEQNKKSLQDYVIQKQSAPDVFFAAIFSKHDNLHIGNIKYEPVDIKNKLAIMGILIGDADWRGKKVAGEVIAASAAWLNENLGIEKVLLAVTKHNSRAVTAYANMGFKISDRALNSVPDDLTMELSLR